MAISKRKTIKSTRTKKRGSQVSKKPRVASITDKSVITTHPKEHGLRKPGYAYAVGRRKTSVARVRRSEPGQGLITINGLEFDKYLKQPELINIIQSPLLSINEKQLDLSVDYHIKVKGGGLHSQAEAIRHGIARLLVLKNNEFRSTLKPAGWLRRDAREKERKKPGLRRARRAPQWQKR